MSTADAPLVRAIFDETEEHKLHKARLVFFNETEVHKNIFFLSHNLLFLVFFLSKHCRARKHTRCCVQRCLKDKLSGIYVTNMDNPVRVPIGTKCGEVYLHTILLPCVFV